MRFLQKKLQNQPESGYSNLFINNISNVSSILKQKWNKQANPSVKFLVLPFPVKLMSFMKLSSKLGHTFLRNSHVQNRFCANEWNGFKAFFFLNGSKFRWDFLFQEVFLLCFFGAEYVVRVWSSGCRVKYRGFKGRLRFARKPIAFIGWQLISSSLISSQDGTFDWSCAVFQWKKIKMFLFFENKHLFQF